MTYSIEWDKKALKYLEKLPREIAKRILIKLDKIAEYPSRYLTHFEGDYYKLRIGDYRILADIDNKEKIVFVRVFDKRSRIYKR